MTIFFCFRCFTNSETTLLFQIRNEQRCSHFITLHNYNDPVPAIMDEHKLRQSKFTIHMCINWTQYRQIIYSNWCLSACVRMVFLSFIHFSFSFNMFFFSLSSVRRSLDQRDTSSRAGFLLLPFSFDFRSFKAI